MRTRTLAYLGLAWALSYIPIHVYWALGGTSAVIGIDRSTSALRTANWGASLVILGAGLTCLSLVSDWGRLLPRAVRAGAAWIGGVFACLHWGVFTAASLLRLTGAVGYPTGGDATPIQLRHFDWWNLFYFELWFGVMGALLIVCALRTRLAPGSARDHIQKSWRRTAGTSLTLVGVATVIWGVFTFDAWIFGVAGPLVMGAGLLALVSARRAAVRASGRPYTPHEVDCAS